MTASDGVRGRVRRASWRTIALITTAWGVMSGCVYYNGVYNAQTNAKRADARLRRDAEDEARLQFQLSAMQAESVLVRYPTSKWRTRALYLHGRGAALGGDCDKGLPSLVEFLAREGTDAQDRERARLALASCEVRTDKANAARARLDSLVGSRDRETARQARLWAARAALAQGDRDAVTGYLGTLDAGALPWELLGASLGARELVRVESLLVLRAARGDYRDDAARAVRELAADGRFAGAERVVRGYDARGIRDLNRGSLHFALGEQYLRAGLDSAARVHLADARTLAGKDTLVGRESAARLAYADLLAVYSLRDADSIFARVDTTVWRTVYARRLREQMLLVRMLASRTDASGASAFLAAEVARDSLRAARLAQGLFVALARTQSDAPLAPHAWYAASLLLPDSAESWRRRIVSQYGFSSVAARLQGEDPASRPDFITTPELLKFTWTEAVRAWSDSLRKLRAVTRVPPSAP
jgi:hypothetical protein